MPVLFLVLACLGLVPATRGVQERLVLDATTPSPAQTVHELQRAVSALVHENSVLQKQLHALNNSLTHQIHRLQQGQSSTYTRWGRTGCYGHGSSLVFSGYAAGPPYGRSASPICLPSNTTWTYHKDGYNLMGGVISAILYKVDSNFSSHAFHGDIEGGVMPCTVCQTPRPLKLVVPAENTCPSGWTKEYQGYMMGAASMSTSGMDYICVDSHAQTLPVSTNQTVYWESVYLVEVRCGYLPCDKFPDGRQLPCVLCSK